MQRKSVEQGKILIERHLTDEVAWDEAAREAHGSLFHYSEVWIPLQKPAR